MGDDRQGGQGRNGLHAAAGDVELDTYIISRSVGIGIQDGLPQRAGAAVGGIGYGEG